jgi:hypothetical protein
MVRRCLRPGGPVWFCDNANPELGWRAGVLPRPEALYVSGDATIDPRTRITTRELPDGRAYRVVKRFFEPDDLTRELDGLGFETSVGNTQWAFLLGRGVRR